LAQWLFDDLKLMTSEEKSLIYETVVHTCPWGPPENVHLRIEFLSRDFGKSIEEIESIYSRLACLGIIAKIKLQKEEEDQICKEYQVIQVEYMIRHKDFPDVNATFILIEIIRIFEERSCPECQKIAWNNLDFSILSTLTGFPES
jgi:hypothetical protein